jgi:predicted neuraminidase
MAPSSTPPCLVMALLVGAVSAAAAAAATSEPSFDGVVRSDADGRFDALLPPPFKSNHASMVEHDSEGSFQMAWFSGKAENTANVAIVVSRLTLNATGGFQNAVWGDAPVVSQREDYSNQNAVLFHDDDTGVMHLFHSQQGGGDGESEATIWYLNRSDDKPSGTGPCKLYVPSP